MNKYGRYIPWPKYLAGVKHIMNIKTENDCMELSMVGHFENKTKKHGGKLRPAKYYRSINRYNTYFEFPKNINYPITLDNFDLIEKKTNTEITLYAVFNENDEYKIKILRKGNNPTNVCEERKIFLCALMLDTDGENLDICHIVLIKDIQNFIRCIRRSSYSKKELEKGKFCITCLSFVYHTKYNRHRTHCGNFKGISNVRLLKNYVPKFSSDISQSLSLSPYNSCTSC